MVYSILQSLFLRNPSFPMVAISCEDFCACHVEPLPGTTDTHAGLIHVKGRRVARGFMDILFKPGQVL